MRITEEEKAEIIAMWLSGEYYNTEIVEWFGISMSSFRRITQEYKKEQAKKGEDVYASKSN